MTMNSPRWSAITDFQFPWEREALEWLRGHLPNHDPWHAWTNFEFVDDEGKVNEVDALVLSSTGLFLIEVKSRPAVTHPPAARGDIEIRTPEKAVPPGALPTEHSRA